MTEQLRYLRASRTECHASESPELFIGIEIIETNATGTVLSQSSSSYELLDVVAIQQQEKLDERRECERVHVFKGHDSTKRLGKY